MAAEIRIIVSSQLQGGAIQQVNSDLREMDKTARDSSGGFSVLSGAAAAALGGVVVKAAGAAASAVGGFIKDSIGGAASFEAGMNQFAAAAGGSLDAAGLKVSDFSDLFLELGAKLPVSTKEVEDAAIALVKGGIDPAILAAGGLESSLNFAAAAGMGLEEAANLSVKMLGTFTSVTDSAATKTEFLANAQDLLTKAANASTLDVDQLGNAMLAAGGQARAAGLNYQDFVTTMGLISPAFGSAAEAGTSFKNFLIRLNPTTKPAIAAMTELGLYTKETGSKFYDAQGKFIGVEKAAQLLKDSLSGLTDQQRVMALQTIFGNDAMGAAATLAQGGSEAYKAFAEQMANANGVTAQAQAVNQGMSFAMTNLSGTIESVQIKLGMALLPTLTAIVNTANTLINAIMGDKAAFDALPGPLQAAVTFVQGLAAQFMALLPTIQMVAGFIAANWQPIMMAVGAVIGAVLLPALVAVAVAMAPVVAAIGAGIAIGMALYNAWTSNFGGIQQIVATALTTIQSIVSTVLAGILAFWAANGASIMATVAQVWAQIQYIIGIALQIIGTIINLALTIINGIVTVWGGTIMAIFTNVWNMVQVIITGALGIISALLTAFMALMQGNWSKMWQAIQQACATFVLAITLIVSNGFQAMWAAVSTILATFVVGVQRIWTSINEATGGKLGELVRAVGDWFNKIGKTIQDVGNTIINDASGVGRGIIDGIISGIVGGMGSLVKAAVSAAKAAIDAAKGALGIHSPSTVFADIGYNTSLGMAQGIASGAPQVAGAASGMGGVAASAASNSVNSSTTRIINYSPTYNRATNSPNSDRAIAAALAGV